MTDNENHEIGRSVIGPMMAHLLPADIALIRHFQGIRLCEHIEDVEGAVVFRQACVMGLEGIVAKRRDSRYHSGRCRDWIKIKNPAHPAIERAMLIALSKRQTKR